MFGRSSLFARKAIQQFVRYDSDGSHGGIPQAGLPFSIQNRYRLTFLMTVLFTVAMGAPFFVVRYGHYKKSGL